MTNGLLLQKMISELPGTSDRETFIDRVIGLCRDLRDPATGRAPFEDVFRREDLYAGRMVEKAPDIVFQESPKYYVTRGDPDSADVPVVQDIWSTSFSAHHRPYGILAVRSPLARQATTGTLRERLAAGGDFRDAHIEDVSPTLLALMQEAIPTQMDGRVLDEAIDPAFLKAHPPQKADVDGFLLDRLPDAETPAAGDTTLRAIPYIQ
jgi:predicted AlkP superfamily phosphohydrolase/phosphomutase